MQAVSVAPASFQNRKSLPKAWQGLRDEQLSETAGIPGCVFVHASGWTLIPLLALPQLPSIWCLPSHLKRKCECASHASCSLSRCVSTGHTTALN